MAKKFWHTWTLFLQNGKYYKWSYKYNHCIECGKCDFKHKWKWLCTSCFDKKRKENPKRKFNLKKQNLKHYFKSRVLLFLEKTERKKKQKTFNLEKYKKQWYKQWYKENQEALLLKAKAYRMKRKWIKCLEMIINWKTKYLPFTEIIEKPATTWLNFKKYDEWKEQQRQFDLLKKYYRA